MTRKQRRATLIATALGVLGVALALVLYALSDSMMYFYTPTELARQNVQPGKDLRLGGLVAKDSVRRGIGTAVEFTVTDANKSVPVIYNGILPDLFREGQGVVTVGRLDAAGRFVASSVLAKHDETYMPPEVAKALKEQGVWQGDAKAPGAVVK
jgi:cytochrome c-type biogenesis protein CcmE